MQLGFINSDSFRRVVWSKKAQMSMSLDGPHSEYYRSMVPMIEKFMAFSITPSTKVADKIINLMKNPQRRLRIPMTFDAVVFSLIKKIIPSMILNHLLYLLLPGSIKWGGRWKVQPIKKAVAGNSQDSTQENFKKAA